MNEISLFWSKAALDAVGPSFAGLRTRVLKEATEIAERAAGWFMHTIDCENPAILLHCVGAEDETGWEVLVRLGEYADLPGIEIPSETAGNVGVKLPQEVDTADNELFVADSDIGAADAR
jgi:hypothetical protein